MNEVATKAYAAWWKLRQHPIHRIVFWNTNEVFLASQVLIAHNTDTGEKK